MWMFCSIRQYESCVDVDELKRRVEQELLPTIRDMNGYRSYVIIESDEGDVASISMFDTHEQAEEANDQVSEIVQKNLLDLLPEAPTVMVGEVIVENRR